MKKIFLNAFSFGTALASLGYAASCLTPWVSQRIFWPLSFLSLGYPYLGAIILLLIVCWLFINKKKSGWLFILLLAGSQNLFSTIGVRIYTHPVARPPGTLRILTWNVRGFDNPSMYINGPGFVRQRMFNYIRDSAPDIVCMQEFTEHYAKSLISNTTELLDMGYDYYYCTNETPRHFPWGMLVSGTAIFSKIPILSSGKTQYPDSSHPENICYVDVKMHGRPLRIFATHFKSLNLEATIPDANQRVPLYGDSNFVYTSSKFEKIKIFSQDHVLESIVAKGVMNNSPYPFIFCGDLNSVPASYQYHIVAKNLQDAFLQRGTGLGNTMDSLPATLRIDYLLADKKIAIKNYVKNDLHLSDHFPQIIDVMWKN